MLLEKRKIKSHNQFDMFVCVYLYLHIIIFARIIFQNAQA